LCAVTSHSVDGAGRVHFSDPVVPRIGDEEVACIVQRDPGWIEQRRTGGRAAVAGIAVYAIADHGGDGACGADLADSVVICVCDEEPANIVHSDQAWRIQRRVRRRAPIPTVAVISVTRHRGDDAIQGNFAHSFVERIRDEQIARAIYCHTCGVVQFGAGGQAAVAGVTVRATRKE
jgi:hypothetical protein